MDGKNGGGTSGNWMKGSQRRQRLTRCAACLSAVILMALAFFTLLTPFGAHSCVGMVDVAPNEKTIVTKLFVPRTFFPSFRTKGAVCVHYYLPFTDGWILTMDRLGLTVALYAYCVVTAPAFSWAPFAGGYANTVASPPEATSTVSWVPFPLIQDGLDQLYPPEELEARNALSRKDGYWAFVREGEDPDPNFTYGEFELSFFAQLLERAGQIWKEHNGDSLCDKVFVDIGSGTGRLVIAAAALNPAWRTCRGIELLEGIHDKAVETVEQCSTPDGSRKLISQGQELPMASIDLVCASFDDARASLGDSDVLFMFSSAVDKDLLTLLSKAIGRECKPGTLVITTDYMLDLEGTVQSTGGADKRFRMELVEKLDGDCWCTGGQSTAFVHRVIESAQGRATRYTESFGLY